jgi:ankyrin repeat protein
MRVLFIGLLSVLLLHATTLHRAAYDDDIGTAADLIKKGADVNAANDLGVTALWLASQNGSTAMVRTLLTAGANPNGALISGETPLMVAARSGKVDVAELLLAKGANPNARATRRQTALMWAVAQKHANVVKLLLANRADIHAKSEVWSQMMAVPPHGHAEYNKMIPHGGYTALLFAARVGDLESAKLLVAAGANVNDEDAWGVSATVLAAHSGYTELVKFLLANGADPNAARAGFSALHEAIMRRDDAMVAALLARGADPNMPLKTWTPTRRSSKDFHFQPALVGATPFWLAARFCQPEVMRLLAKHGADPRIVHTSKYMLGERFNQRIEKTTPILAALGNGGGTPWVPIPTKNREALVLETIRVAAELGANPKAANTDGRTAIEVARAMGYSSVVRYLEQR